MIKKRAKMMVDISDDITTLLILLVISGILSREEASEIYAKSISIYTDDEKSTGLYKPNDEQ